jgi:ferric-dicitrate binding protein FerR (iron transport regulator)
VRFGETRRIRLDGGIVRIHAAKNPDHPMIVETPMGDVRVTGTVFSVEIVK